MPEEQPKTEAAAEVSESTTTVEETEADGYYGDDMEGGVEDMDMSFLDEKSDDATK